MDESETTADQLSHLELVAYAAAVYQALGYEIEIEAQRAGLVLDLLATRKEGRRLLRTAVECKAFTRLVGLRTMRAFAATAEFLRARKIVHKAALVTTSGFTLKATRAAERHSIEALTLDELLRRPHEQVDASTWRSQLERVRTAPRAAGKAGKRVFVLMPFHPHFLDVYILGIRWVAERLKIVVERADDLEHNGEVIGEVQAAIRSADAVIGETTGANPNVCYEVGYAHASRVPAILICRDDTDVPFDLRGVNHIRYPNIVDLRSYLEPRLRSTLGL